MENELDLYDDILISKNEEQVAITANKLKRCDFLEKENEELRVAMAKLENEMDVVTKRNNNLKRNISVLYKTAKLEIERKESLLSDLQARYDNLVFRRLNKSRVASPGNVSANNSVASGTASSSLVFPINVQSCGDRRLGSQCFVTEKLQNKTDRNRKSDDSIKEHASVIQRSPESKVETCKTTVPAFKSVVNNISNEVHIPTSQNQLISTLKTNDPKISNEIQTADSKALFLNCNINKVLNSFSMASLLDITKRCSASKEMQPKTCEDGESCLSDVDRVLAYQKRNSKIKAKPKDQTMEINMLNSQDSPRPRTCESSKVIEPDKSPLEVKVTSDCSPASAECHCDTPMERNYTQTVNRSHLSFVLHDKMANNISSTVNKQKCDKLDGFEENASKNGEHLQSKLKSSNHNVEGRDKSNDFVEHSGNRIRNGDYESKKRRYHELAYQQSKNDLLPSSRNLDDSRNRKRSRNNDVLHHSGKDNFRNGFKTDCSTTAHSRYSESLRENYANCTDNKSRKSDRYSRSGPSLDNATRDRLRRDDRTAKNVISTMNNNTSSPKQMLCRNSSIDSKSQDTFDALKTNGGISSPVPKLFPTEMRRPSLKGKRKTGFTANGEIRSCIDDCNRTTHLSTNERSLLGLKRHNSEQNKDNYRNNDKSKHRESRQKHSRFGDSLSAHSKGSRSVLKTKSHRTRHK